MKQKILLVITLAITCSFITKPFSFSISALDPKSGTVKAALEKSDATIQTKGRTSATSSSYIISNARSTVRIKVDGAVFQSSLISESLGGPSDYISLYRLSSDRISRSFTINTNGTTNALLVPIKFIPGENRFKTKILPVSLLFQGEYAFVDRSATTSDGITVWTFGID